MIGVAMPMMRSGKIIACRTAPEFDRKCTSWCVKSTPSQRPTTPKMTMPRRTLAQPHFCASSGCLRPSACPMRVAVAVPNAMHAVKVSLSVSTMSVFAALLTASRPVPSSRCPTVLANRPKPPIMTTMAMAAGIDSLSRIHVVVREMFAQAHRSGTPSGPPTSRGA